VPGVNDKRCVGPADLSERRVVYVIDIMSVTYKFTNDIL